MRLNRNLKAIGLLELMLVLIIIALIIVMVFSYYRTASTSSKVTTAYRDIETIASAGQSYWGDHQNSFSDITNIDVLIDNGYLGVDFKRNPWGGDTLVTALTKSKLQIQMQQTDPKGCAQLATRFGFALTDADKVCIKLLGSINPTFTICTTGAERYAICGS